MASYSPAVMRAVLLVCSALLIAAASADYGHAQARLDLSYTLSAARIVFGEVPVSAQIGANEYSMSGSGHLRSFGRTSARGQGSSRVQGVVEGSRLLPVRFSSQSTYEGGPMEVTVVFEDGNVKEVSTSKPRHMPPADAHLQAVIDPLTALLIPAELSPEGCEHTVRIFDGYQRYDVALAFKRMGKVKAKEGYAGPALICSAAYRPVGGQRGSTTLPSFLVDFLSGREMEVTLAPLAGVRMLAPFQVSLSTMIGSLVAQASRFNTAAQ